MANTDFNIDRKTNIGFGVFYSFLTLVLIIIGSMFHPVIFFLLAAVSLGFTLMLFFTQKDAPIHF